MDKIKEEYYVILICLDCGKIKFKMNNYGNLICLNCGKIREHPLGIWVCNLEHFLTSQKCMV